MSLSRRMDLDYGNHDAKDLADNPLAHMRFEMSYRLDDVIFTHEFCDEEVLQIGGHFHPKISITMKSNKITGKCFMVSKTKIIMPAFRTYTGGLNASIQFLQPLSRFLYSIVICFTGI